jgi:hypothetical protein
VSLSGAITLEASGGVLPQGFSGYRVNPSPLGAAVTGDAAAAAAFRTSVANSRLTT